METEKENTNELNNYSFDDLYELVEKNKDNLSNIDIKLWKKLCSMLLTSKLDYQKQIKIIEIFLENFFAQKLENEYLSCFPNFFSDSYDFFKLKPYLELLQDYYDKYFKKEPIDITKINKDSVLDFLVIHNKANFNWTRCPVINTDIEKRLVTLQVPYLNETFTVSIDSFRVYPVNTFTKDYQWRQNLKSGDLVDALDEFDNWIKATIIHRINDIVRVGFRLNQSDKSFYGYTPEFDIVLQIYDYRIQKYESLSFNVQSWEKYPNGPMKVRNNRSDMHIPFIGNNYCIPLYTEDDKCSLEKIEFANYIIRKLVHVLDTQDDKWINNLSFSSVNYLIELLHSIRVFIHRSFSKDFIKKVFEQILKKSLNNYSKNTKVPYSVSTLDLCFEHLFNILFGCVYQFEAENYILEFKLEFILNLLRENRENTTLEKRLYELKVLHKIIRPNSGLFFTDEQISYITRELLIENEKGETFIDLIFNSNNHIEIIKKGSSIISRLFMLKVITITEIEKLYNYIQIFNNNIEIQNEIYSIFETNVGELNAELSKNLCAKILLIDNNTITIRDVSLLLSICRSKIIICKDDGGIDKDLKIQMLNKVYEFIFRKNQNKSKEFVLLMYSFFQELMTPEGGGGEKFGYFVEFFEKSVKNIFSDDDLDKFEFFISYLTIMVQCMEKYKQEIASKIKNELIVKNENGAKFKLKIINFGKEKKDKLNATNFSNFEVIFEMLEINLTENEINELFDVYVFNLNSIIIHNAFLKWITELEKLKLCDLSLSQDHLMNNLTSYCSNEDNKDFINEAFVTFFYDFFISLTKDTIITNSKHFDTFYQFLLKYGSIRILHKFITFFSFKKLSQGQRFEIWSDFVDKLIETLKKKIEEQNNKEILSLLNLIQYLIQFSECCGTALCKSHLALIKKNNLIEVYFNTIAFGKVPLTVNSNDTIYDLKNAISKKLNIEFAKILTMKKFDTIEVDEQSNGSLIYNSITERLSTFSFKSPKKFNEKTENNKDGEFAKKIKKLFDHLFYESERIIYNNPISSLESNEVMARYSKYIERLTNLMNNNREKFYKMIYCLGYDSDLSKIIVEQFPENTKTEWMPRSFISQNKDYFTTLLKLQIHSSDDVANEAMNLIEMLETNKEIYDNALNNKIKEIITNDILEQIYFFQIVNSLFENETDKEWIHNFIFGKNEENEKTSFEKVVSMYLNSQIPENLEVKKQNDSLSRLINLLLKIILKSILKIINNENFSKLLQKMNHLDDDTKKKEIEKFFSTNIISEISKNDEIFHHKEQLLQLQHKIITNFDLYNSKTQNLLIRREITESSVKIMVIITILFNDEVLDAYLDFILKHILVNNSSTVYISRNFFLANKIITNLITESNPQSKFMDKLYKEFNKMLTNILEIKNKSTKFLVYCIQDILKFQSISIETEKETINFIQNILINNYSELNEEIITGLFNMTRNILQNLSQRYKDNQELPIKINQTNSIQKMIDIFLITENQNSYNSLSYVVALYDLLTSYITIEPESERISNIIEFVNHPKIQQVTKYVTTFNEPIKMYKPCKNTKAKGLVGISNLGAICYMNSVLQQFFMIPKFKNTILTLSNPDKDNLLYQLQKMFVFLSCSERQFYLPTDFIEKFKDIDGKPTNPYVQCDAQEFLSRFIEQLEENLKSTPYNHLLYSVFGGETCSILKCTNTDCNKVRKSYEKIYYLSLDIKECLNLDDCLHKYIKEEIIEDFLCDNCKKKITQKRHLMINTLPNILIIHLQRIAFNYETFEMEKVNSKVEFEQNISLKEFCIKDKEEEAIDEEDYKYKLMGIIIHSGNAQGGHYFSFIDSRLDKNKQTWFKFNDSEVTEEYLLNLKNVAFGDSDVTAREIEELFPTTGIEKVSCGFDRPNSSAYMLVYEKIKKNGFITKLEEPSNKEGIINVKTEKELQMRIDHKEVFNKVLFVEETNEHYKMTPYPEEETEIDRKQYPKELYEWIIKDNIYFANDMRIYNVCFDKFLFTLTGQLSDYVTKSKMKQEELKIKIDSLSKVVNSLFKIIFTICTKLGYKDKMDETITNLIKIVQLYPSQIIPEVLNLDIFNNIPSLIKSFIFSIENTVGLSMSNLLGEIITLSYQNNIVNEKVDSIILSLSAVVTDYLRTKMFSMDKYFLTLYTITLKSPELFEKMNLLHKLITFFKNNMLTELGRLRYNLETKCPYFNNLFLIFGLVIENHLQGKILLSDELIEMLTQDCLIRATIKLNYGINKYTKALSKLMNNNEKITNKILEIIETILDGTMELNELSSLVIFLKNMMKINDKYTMKRIYGIIGIFSLDYTYDFKTFLPNNLKTTGLFNLINNNLAKIKDNVTMITKNIYKALLSNKMFMDYCRLLSCPKNINFNFIRIFKKNEEKFRADLSKSKSSQKLIDKMLEYQSKLENLFKLTDENDTMNEKYQTVIIEENVNYVQFSSETVKDKNSIKLFYSICEYTNGTKDSIKTLFTPSRYENINDCKTISDIPKTELDDKPTSKFLRIFLIATIKAEIKISIPSIDLEATRLIEPEKTNEIIISEKLDLSLKDINIEIVNVVEPPKMIEAEKEKPQPDNGGESLTISCLKCNFINIIKQDTQVFICQKCGTDLFS